MTVTNETFAVYCAGEQVPGTEIGIGYIYVTTPLGNIRMTAEEADDLGRKLTAAAKFDRDSERAEDGRCPACACIDPECATCTNGDCRNDDPSEWVHCSRSRCPNAERLTKATERGWQHRQGAWHCSQHAEAGEAA